MGENTNERLHMSAVDGRDEERSLLLAAAPLERRISLGVFGNTVGTILCITSGGGLHLVARSQGC